MTRPQIIALVRAKMDEIQTLPTGATIVDPQIDQQLDASAVDLIESLPSVLAMPVSASLAPTTVNYIDGLSVDVKCPSDFIRIHRLRLKTWKRSITELFPDGSRLFYMQDYKYLKSTVHRPMAALYFMDGHDYITCYPAPVIAVPIEEPEGEPEGEPTPPASMVEEFIYVKRPATAQSLHDSLIEMLAWNTAYMVYAISGQPENANICRARLTEMVQQKLKYRGL